MRRKDWVSRTYGNEVGAAAAILIGAVLGWGMTLSLMIPLSCRGDRMIGEAVTVALVEPAFVDPRGPERGPTAVEWEVIRAYKPIESMTADAPSAEAVAAALTRLQQHAEAHPENPYIQELYLKGLRVAAYWAEDAGQLERAAGLRTRFDAYAIDFVDYDGVALEIERFDRQDLDGAR